MKDINIKIPWDKKSFCIFGAFPWDLYVRQMYEDVFKDLKKEHKDIKVRYGMKVLSEDPRSSQIEEFMNRNKQLYDTFVNGIERSDIFIADITKQNPNVMLELGIAMQLNKNILILTSDKKNKYPFDIQNVRIETYTSKEELAVLIDNFIKLFKTITTQSFEKYINSLYYKSDKPIKLSERQNVKINVGNMKNLKIRFNYQFLDHVHTADWIGVYLRTMGPETYNSELIYSRVDGTLESVTMPHLRKIVRGEDLNNPVTRKTDKMQVEIIENNILADTNTKLLKDDKVMIESFGEVKIGCWHHPDYPHSLKDHTLKVEINNLEIICLDTTTPLA